MKKEIIGIFVCVIIISFISFVSACLYNYESVNYYVHNKEYISYEYKSDLKFNKNIYKLNRHKLPTIILKEETE